MLQVQPRDVDRGHALMFGKHRNIYPRVFYRPPLEVHGFCRSQRRHGIIFVIQSAENQQAAAIAHGDGGGPRPGPRKVSVRNPFVAVVKVARSVEQESSRNLRLSKWVQQAASDSV